MTGQPERLDHFMARANAAYYAGRDPFADFITSPEISQMFGELLGAWVAVVWEQLGRPAPFVLAEAGPGRGTLMADALRLLRRVAPACHAAARVHLIETSPRLRACQKVALKDATPTPVNWHDGLASLPEGPFILLGNEFVDALPIRQFVRHGQGWAERFVQAGRFVEQAAVLPPGHPALARSVPEGDVLETCQPALDFVSTLAARLQRGRGAALLIDYGYDAPAWGDSLQALRAGQPVDPLCDPGTADLTAHVDFASMAQAAGGVDVWGSVKQGDFLGALGLGARCEQLARAAPDQAHDIRAAARRLAAPEQMGRLFRVLGLSVGMTGLLPGFAGVRGSGAPQSA
ncbi:class I SAM-dependent methyltransferase [Komagataeibacter xylinus]|uniref:Class I SAM-dependent methyltransferase n=1 Tax=Komagataeibacter xylinus TaxID=28448 RepID=A0A857FKQ4_KOMXY|nr:SAM-dependent methyltransferase [Komagataeibacter xylinus]QHC34761.1 class I SAM-dependent methyltransferase [Komagataeibacter xylinus]